MVFFYRGMQINLTPLHLYSKFAAVLPVVYSFCSAFFLGYYACAGLVEGVITLPLSMIHISLYQF